MKENFIKSTIILMVGGILAKVLGMFIKIFMARTIGVQGLGIYMLVLPTFTLVISISQFGLPLALAKLISENTKSTKKLFFSILPIAIIINIIMMFLIILLSPIISSNFLKNSNLKIIIQSMALIIPFTTISSICRSYYFGKSRMIPNVISTIIEALIRLFFIIIIIPLIIPYGIYYTIHILILSNIISESLSTIVLILFLPAKIKIKRKDILPDKKYIKESLQIAIPNTTSRLISSIGYFLEPIILTNVLLQTGYTRKYIIKEYGIISGYIIPLLLLPSFFTLAISEALLPVISKEQEMGNIRNIKKKIKQAVLFSFFIALPVTFLLMIKPDFFLKTIYHTKEGIPYLEVLAPICLLQYFQAPISSSLEAMGKSKDIMKITVVTTTIRTILTYFLGKLKIGLWSLISAISINIILTTYLEVKQLKKYL